ncbi:MAG: hypothetical protein QXU98_13285 [Candidatus Parvarchaeota archaeon]
MVTKKTFVEEWKGCNGSVKHVYIKGGGFMADDYAFNLWNKRKVVVDFYLKGLYVGYATISNVIGILAWEGKF